MTKEQLDSIRARYNEALTHPVKDTIGWPIDIAACANDVSALLKEIDRLNELLNEDRKMKTYLLERLISYDEKITDMMALSKENHNLFYKNFEHILDSMRGKQIDEIRSND